MSAGEIDKLIRSFSRQQWQKVAMILAKTLSECERRDISTSYEDIAERVAVLVSSRQLESKGDITNWRYSEIRLSN